MKTYRGLSVTDDLFAYAERLEADEERFGVYALEIDSWEIPTCSNCNGNGKILLARVLGGPIADARSGYTWLKDGYYRVDYTFYPCPLCQKEEAAIDIAEKLLEESGLLPEERAWSLDYLEDKGKDSALKLVRHYMSSGVPRGFLWLFGDYGVGKSGILKSLTAMYCYLGVKAMYRRAVDIVSEAQATFGAREPDADSADWLKYRYSRYAFLAIDEIDRISRGDWTQSFVFSLMDERYNRRKSIGTALASNRNLEQMPEFGYLADRLRDGLRVSVGGAKLRGEIGEFR